MPAEAAEASLAVAPQRLTRTQGMPSLETVPLAEAAPKTSPQESVQDGSAVADSPLDSVALGDVTLDEAQEVCEQESVNLAEQSPIALDVVLSPASGEVIPLLHGMPSAVSALSTPTRSGAGGGLGRRDSRGPALSPRTSLSWTPQKQPRALILAPRQVEHERGSKEALLKSPSRRNLPSSGGGKAATAELPKPAWVDVTSARRTIGPCNPSKALEGDLKLSQEFASSPSKKNLVRSTSSKAMDSARRSSHSPKARTPTHSMSPVIRPRGGVERRLRDSQTLAPQTTFAGDVRCVAAVVSDQDCRAWTGDRSGGISVRDPDTFQALSVLPRTEDAEGFVWCLRQFGNAVWSGTSSGRLRIYDPYTTKLLAERRRHSGGIYAMAASSGCVYTASNDFTILEWSEITYDATGRIFSGHTNQVRSLIACPSSSLVSGGDDQTARIWNIARGENTQTLKFSGSVLALLHVPEEGCPLAAGYRRGSLWVGDGSGALVVLSWQDPRRSEQLPPHRGAVHALLWKHAYVFSASADNTVRIWDPVNQTVLDTLDAHCSYVFALEPVKHEARTLFWTVSGDKTIQSWLMIRSKPTGEQLDHLRMEIADLKARTHQAHDERLEMEASQESLEAKVARLEAELESAKQEKEHAEDDLRKQLSVAEDTAGQHFATLQKRNFEIEALHKREAELQGLRPELSKQTALAAELRAQNSGLLSELSCVEGQLRAALENKAKLEQEAEDVASLRTELRKAQAEACAWEGRQLDLQAAIKQAEQEKLSHFTFSTEVWGLHRLLLETKRSTQVVAQVHVPKLTTAPTALQQDARLALESSTRSLNHCVSIISKCFTEEEKRQCGVAEAGVEEKCSKAQSSSLFSGDPATAAVAQGVRADALASSAGAGAAATVSLRGASSTGRLARTPSGASPTPAAHLGLSSASDGRALDRSRSSTPVRPVSGTPSASRLSAGGSGGVSSSAGGSDSRVRSLSSSKQKAKRTLKGHPVTPRT